MDKTIEQQIFEHSIAIPDKIAIKCGKQEITYSLLWKKILVAKEYFESLPGYKKGKIVIIAANKSVEFVYAYFGAHLAGLISVPLDSETKANRLEYIIGKVQPLCIVGVEFEIANNIDIKVFKNNTDKPTTQVTQFPKLEEVADILFTTGTTGKPKGVLLTYGNESSAAKNINEFIRNSIEDVELLALPVCHSFGLGRVRCCLSKGQTLILVGSFVNVKRLFRLIKEDFVAGFSMVPASWKYLQKVSGDELGNSGKNLKYIEMGSAYLSVEDKMHLSSILPNTRICMHYGLTEASRSTFIEFHDDCEHLDTIGKPSPNTEIIIVDENGNEVSRGHEGEICVKGLHVMAGYLYKEAHDSFHKDYFKTGDYGLIDNDGYIKLTGRIKELINVGGKKVAPSEVEEQILKIPGVQDCACVAVSDSDNVLGEVVKAFIVRNDETMTFDAIRTHLVDKLESYKIPTVYEWIDAIPRSENGKILRRLLKE